MSWKLTYEEERTGLSSLDEKQWLNPSKASQLLKEEVRENYFSEVVRMSWLGQVLGHLAPCGPTLRPIRPWVALKDWG